MSKAYNPKSHAPAVYIPTWLIQVDSKHLSLSAKVLYGRLAQWANTKSCVHRSTNQLAEEMGVGQRVIERYLKELRDVGLIETFQVKKGGENYYKFLDHDWIHSDLLPVFDWNKNDQTPRDENDPTPSDRNVGTPPTETSVPSDISVGAKVKEIKRSKKEKSSCSTGVERQSNPVKKTNKEPKHFERFWQAWPRKQKRAEARKVWLKNKLDEKADQIINSVVINKTKNVQWQNKQYIPMASTWLNNEQWQDEIITETVERSKEKQVRQERSEPTHNYSSMRDFTQERIDSEAAKERGNGISASGNQTRN